MVLQYAYGYDGSRCCVLRREGGPAQARMQYVRWYQPFLYMVSRGKVDSVGSSEPSTGAAPTSALSSTASKSESNFVRFA